MDWLAYWTGRRDGGHRYASEAFLALEADEKLFHLGHGKTLLDFGCGAGQLLSYYADHYECVGADFSESMLTAASERLRSRGNTAELVAADESTIWNQVAGREFDRITAAGVIQYLSAHQVAAFLTSARCRLAARGRLVLFDVIDPRPLYLYERRMLTPGHPVPSLARVVSGSAHLQFRRAARRMKGLPPLELGTAHLPDTLMTLAESSGFATCTIARSMYYEYRYHVIYDVGARMETT